jgi:GGDEF domain-containing protein
MSADLNERAGARRLRIPPDERSSSPASRPILDAFLSTTHDLCRDQGLPLFAAFIVVDEFDQLCTDFGGTVSSEVLAAVGETVVRQCRSYDLAAEYDDAAFMVVFDRVDRTVIDSIVSRFAASISSVDWQRLRPGLQVSATVVASNLAEDSSIEKKLAELENLADARRVNRPADEASRAA